ncbi:MAG: hypothetical protein EXQ82_06475 [Pseudolabrys sp.]|nr:hypothetical protein [Pseudolabrys sp.]
MRYLGMAAAGVCLLAMSANSSVNAAPAAGGIEAKSPIVLAQATTAKKDETIKQKVKRVWRDMTGYKFSVGCPAIIPLSRSTCTATGKNRDVARAKCQSQNVLCSVSDVK